MPAHPFIDDFGLGDGGILICEIQMNGPYDIFVRLDKGGRPRLGTALLRQR